jgi:hypothetical protein
MKALFALLFSLFLFAQTFVQDAFDPQKRPITPSILNATEAQNIFWEFKSSEQIPFDYAPEGCFARATAMARIAEKKNIIMAKVFAEGRLIARTGDKKFDPVEWSWHVAPMLYVDSGNGPVLTVFDPTLFDRPVPLDQWLQSMESEAQFLWLKRKGKVARHYFGERFQSWADGSYVATVS